MSHEDINLIANCKSRLLLEEDMNDFKAKEIIEDTIIKYDKSLTFKEIREETEKIFYKIKCKNGLIEKYLRDSEIDEIIVNGYEDIYIEKFGKVMKVDDAFDSVGELENIIQNIGEGVSREFNELNPILDARLKDGSRVNAVHKAIALGGPTLNIRKFKKSIITMDSLLDNKSLTKECMEYLKKSIKNKVNVFVSGGTSTGKTTFLNALSDFIPEDERVILIEDSSELQIPNVKDKVSLECRNSNSIGIGAIDIDMLIKTSLRMRPDRIIVGEVRGREVASMLQALNTGHVGMSTGHGNSISGMLRRMEAMYLMGVQIPIDAIRSQIIEAIQVMVHLEREESGRRKVSQVAEITGYHNGSYDLNYLFLERGVGRKKELISLL